VRELQTTLDRAGIDIRVGHGSLLDANTIRIESDSARTDLIRADYIIIATGSRPRLDGKGLGPQSLGVDATPFVRVDEHLRTSLPHVFAIGDVNSLGSMDSLAVAQARIAAAAILGKRTPYAPRWLPKCVYTNPIVASVGWTEEEAGRAGMAAITYSDSFLIVTEDERSVLEPIRLMLKILVDSESRQIRGLHAIGPHAAELVNAAALAIRSGITIDQLSEIIFVHPSPIEAIQSFSIRLRSLRDG
jgi:pyruvate/2-oxoglutarate dehydrogenase complex dihydrolipoamide dehydrogenase (E3) component